jgi:phage tail sheath protein FI
MTRFNVVFSALIAACVLFAQAATAEVTRLSEPVAVTDDAEIFGAPLDENARATSLDALLDSPGDFVDTAVRVDARISQVCQKKGCFMIATVGDRAVRISFRDYSFFVPTDTGGKTVTLTGTFIERELSEKQAAHFREDAGTDTLQAGKVYEIVADAVSIPKS